MSNLTSRYACRIAAAGARIEEAYRHREKAPVPFLVADANYWLSGETPSLIPDDYFTNCESMLQFQLRKMERHMESLDDDFIPFLFPWYGTGVLASALGCPTLFQAKMDPAIQGTAIHTPEQVRRLSLPDPQKDGLMPRVLETIRHFRAHSDLPVSFTDPQGPLTTALTVVGPETLFVWFYERPREARELLEFCTEAFIRWVKAQKQEIGPTAARGCFPHGILLPKTFGTVWLSDDDCVAISAEHYRKFVMPCNARVFREFGGGTLHFCGSAEHQIENFSKTEGLAGVNNFCMGNFRQLYKMQDVFADRVLLMACDYTPRDIEAYYADLFRGLKRKGTVVASFISPEMALNEGKYEVISRTGPELAGEVYRVLRRHVER